MRRNAPKSRQISWRDLDQTHTTMKKLLLAFGICIFGFIGTYYVVSATASCNCPLYDGEGNKVPDKAVKALVKSQYVQTTPEEDSLITRYFK